MLLEVSFLIGLICFVDFIHIFIRCILILESFSFPGSEITVPEQFYFYVQVGRTKLSFISYCFPTVSKSDRACGLPSASMASLLILLRQPLFILFSTCQVSIRCRDSLILFLRLSYPTITKPNGYTRVL